MKLLLDEMFDPAIARALRRRGHDVVAAVDLPELRASSDRDVLEWAAHDSRALVSENVQDFLPLHRDVLAAGGSHPGLVLTTHRKFPRTSQGVGQIVTALAAALEDSELDLRARIHWL